MAWASLVHRAGSARPMTSSTMPSRRAHALMVSSAMPNSSMATTATIEPAGIWSARRASRPSILVRWARVDAMMSAWRASISSRVTVTWLSDAGTAPVRRASAIRARSDRVPLVATVIVGRREAISSATGARVAVMRSRRRRASSADGGSSRTSSVVRRPTPRGRVAARSRPSGPPTITSRLPPPRSRHRAGPGSMTTLARTAWKISRASSSPLSSSTRTPVAA